MSLRGGWRESDPPPEKMRRDGLVQLLANFFCKEPNSIFSFEGHNISVANAETLLL